jgi:16S rRNA (adenine1518-N6/adenine1519-N6)-dimethyltransferase
MTEYFDWVDRHDQVIGITSREDAHRLNLYHRAVHLYARGEKGGLILQKRSLSKDVEPGRWTVSCSGHVDRGETFLDAAIRELREELGVSVGRSDLVALLHSDPSPANGYEFVRSYEVLTPVRPVYNPDEISELCEITLTGLDDWMKREPASFATSFRALFPLARKRFSAIR